MASEPATKRQATMLRIGTHDGRFHCDEALACYLLKQLDQFKNAEIVRSRNPSVLETCDIVVDVGGVYDPSKHRYDHHQRSFNETMHSLDAKRKGTIKLSSAGLIYFHFGVDILSQLFELPATNPAVEIVYEKLYENFFQEIDAIDNGVNQTEEEPRYRITTHLSSRVNDLNPQWYQKDQNEMEQFEKAMELVGKEFNDRVLFYRNSWLPARDLVAEAVRNRDETDASGQIICMKNGAAPWKDHLFSLEKELAVSSPILYVLFPEPNGNWRVQCVPVSLSSFENRLSLKEEWRGLRDAELSEKSKIENCVFVHTSGFIGGNKTYDGALEMARRSIQQ